MPRNPEQQVGRYAIFEQIASGGMAAVHLARLVGPEGFSRVVAIKRMHRHLLENPNFKRMFVAEARMAARVRHPNVVPILDVLAKKDELLIVMEYVHGQSVHALMRAANHACAPIELSIACAVMVSVLHGLHAVHEARDEQGRPLGLVHRDVSPQNVLVGVDGVARVLDFGVAESRAAQQDTQARLLKGKFSYMAPEVVSGSAPTRQSDVFSAATMFWELLTGRKLFGGATDQERLLAIARGDYPSPTKYFPDLSRAVELVVLRGLETKVENRYATALEMALALETASPPTTPRLVGECVAELAGAELSRRADLIAAIETSTISVRTSLPPPSGAPPSSVSRSQSPTAPGVALRSRQRRLWYIGAGAALAASALVLIAALRTPEARGTDSATARPATGKVEPQLPLPPLPSPAPAIEPRHAGPVIAPFTAQPSSGQAGAPSAERATPPARPLGAQKKKARPKEFLPNDL